MNQDTIRRYNGILYNGFFIFFVLLLKDPLLSVASDVFFNGSKNLPFVFLILFLFYLDIYAIYWKLPIIARRAESEQLLKEAKDFAIVLWIGRFVVHSALGFSIIIGLGASPEEPGIAGAIFPLIVIKEIIVGALFASRLEKKEDLEISPRRELLANLALWISATFIYVILWENLASSFDMSNYQGNTFYIEMFAALVLFAFFFFPIQAIYIIEDLTWLDTKKEYFFWFTSLLLATIAGMSPMF